MAAAREGVQVGIEGNSSKGCGSRQGGRSEESALDNAFMFSLIESCKLNGLAPEKYITFLLRKLKGTDQYTDKNALLPCFCTA